MEGDRVGLLSGVLRAGIKCALRGCVFKVY